MTAKVLQEDLFNSLKCELRGRQHERPWPCRLLKRMQKKNKGAILKPVTDDKAPILRTSTANAEEGKMTERQRRQQEFDLVRRIQEEAATKRRWTSLIFLEQHGLCSGSQEQLYSRPLNTDKIGLTSVPSTFLHLPPNNCYGDFYSQSNSGKPFFVFWSLLAVPSLKILISNMGDTIVKGIRDLTLWVGKFTVLPG